jgi:hypothetical protein
MVFTLTLMAAIGVTPVGTARVPLSAARVPLGTKVPFSPAAAPGSAAKIAPSAVPGFKITACTYQLIDSRAGNKNYYLMVDVKYKVSRPVAAVRYTFDINNAVQNMIGQHFKLGKGSQQFRLISPAAAVTTLTCTANLPLP